MATNVCFALLDAPVIGGRGEDPCVAGMSHARLLEEAAAVGGVLSHLGVGISVPVVIDLVDDLDALVAALAAARIGGVVTTEDRSEAPVVIVSAGSAVSAEGRTRLVRGEEVREPDLEWGVMLRAGRTDPAACAVLAPEAAYSPERSVGEQIALLAGVRAPYDARELRRLLQV